MLIERKNQYLHDILDPSFQGINRIFVLSFENDHDRKAHREYITPKVETKDYKAMIDE